jgi:hypothetical protein
MVRTVRYNFWNTTAVVVVALFATLLVSCSPTLSRGPNPVYLGRQPGATPTTSSPRLALPTSVQVPSNGGSPQTGTASAGARSSARVMIFNTIGQKINLKNGETVNLLYEGIDPEAAYLRYESTMDGYTLELAPRDQYMMVNFERLCQKFIIDNPANAAVFVAEDLRYEQVVWTPRDDGLWEVRIGSTNRGCESEALDKLNKLRSTEYERNLPRGTGNR